MIVPLPRQSPHGSENAKAPWLRLTTPTPLQVGQVRGDVPGLAPSPLQTSQVTGLDNRSGSVTPCTESAKSIRTSVSTSAPRCDRLVVAPPRLPNRLPNMSPSPPNPPVWVPCAPPKMSPRSKLLAVPAREPPKPPWPKPPAPEPPPVPAN